jgi:predicted  nucleic acid-binding Zn-ribbon protein
LAELQNQKYQLERENQGLKNQMAILADANSDKQKELESKQRLVAAMQDDFRNKMANYNK